MANSTLNSTSRGIAAAIALLTALLLSTAVAQAGSGGVGPGGTGNSSGGSSEGTIEGLSPSYAKFSQLVADKTDLSLRVVGAWTLAEGGPRDNPLNIGPGHHFGTVGGGARATANLLEERIYRGVMQSVGEPDPSQIGAIADSPWCPGCRGYERLLKRTYRSVDVQP